MRISKTIVALAALALAGLALPALALAALPAMGADLPNSNGTVNPPQPGTVNYIEGAASLDGRPLSNRYVGSIALDTGQVLATGTGKAEILLTPGVFLRLGPDSAIKMMTPDLDNTQIELDYGRASVEIDQIFPQNMIQIVDHGVTAQLMKTGYYEFDASHPEVMVFKGEAMVQSSVGQHVGEGKWMTVKGHHELALAAGVLTKPVGFDAQPDNDELYNWSRLRSQYMAEANNQIADQYANAQGFDPGWYWNPSMLDYAYLGMDPFYSPFGWGFYPWGGYGGGWGGFGGWGGLYGGGYYGGGYYGGRGFYGNGFRAHSHMGSGFRGGSFHTGSGGFHGGSGGFHGGGGGGFHGGGGGGFHGGGGGGGGGGGFHGGGGGGGGGGRR